MSLTSTIAETAIEAARNDPLKTGATILLSILIFQVLKVIYNSFFGISLRDIQGPRAQNFWLGNLGQLMKGTLGQWDLPWLEQYGSVFRYYGPFGEKRLWLADPKALQYVLNTSSYRFVKPNEARYQLATSSGWGLNSSEGPDHQRQRRVLLPAFGGPETRSLMPIFRNAIQELTAQWKEKMVNEGEFTKVLDMPAELGNAVLDALGHAAFEYDFGALNKRQSLLTRSLFSFGPIGFANASDGKIFSQGVLTHFPVPVLDAVRRYFPSEGLRFLKKHVQLCNSVAVTLIEAKKKALEAGHIKKDVLSLIIKSNLGVESKYRLEDREIIPQLSTMLVAGHETTTSTIGWILFALSNHPECQTRLREEIHETQAKARGELTPAHYDAMPYLNAVIKETFRFECVVPHIFREATRDDVIPLSKPIRTRSGKIITEVPVPKGARLIVSIIGYNRLPEIWGPDVDKFRPERWLDGSINTSGANVGVTGSLMTFGSGHRGCIGWRFAYVEIQAFLVELIGNFEFSHTGKSKQISRQINLAMRAMVASELEKGVQMPLRVTLVN